MTIEVRQLWLLSLLYDLDKYTFHNSVFICYLVRQNLLGGLLTELGSVIFTHKMISILKMHLEGRST